MPNITIKGIPSALHRELKARAKARQRSLNREIISSLQKSAGRSTRIEEADLEKSVRRVRALFRKPLTGRQIDQWKRTGRL